MEESRGWTLPPEWVQQEAVWLSWPVEDERHWGGTKSELIRNKFAEIAAVLSRFERVCINAVPHLERWLRDQIRTLGGSWNHITLFDHPHNDVWCRDHGPLFVKDRDSGEVAVTDWKFNGWGEHFAPWDLDDGIPALIASSLAMRRFSGGMVLEGGAIEVNGNGQALTTEAVLLNPNRNPRMTRSEIEDRLRTVLGIVEVLWLPNGLAGDDTGGHVDNLARFVNDKTLLAAEELNPATPNHSRLQTTWNTLRNFGFDLLPMPMPEVGRIPGWRLEVLPASYLNYVLVNGAVVAPTFRQAKSDHRALDILRESFPGREVVGIDCLDLIEEGGALHCLTQNQPA